MPTDTLYGILGQAQNKNAVERIYAARKRSPDKASIILIGDIRELSTFGVQITEEQRKAIQDFSTPTSFIVDCPNPELSYLHRGTNSLAFRIPVKEELRSLLMQTGPLIAPSANTEGMPPSESIAEAKEYFGQAVDLYVDGGIVTGKASRLVRLHEDGTLSILRA